MKQHSPGLDADRAVQLFEEHFEHVGGQLWRMRFNRRSANPLEWISVDFFSKGRALDPRFLRFLMSMTWQMKTPAFRSRVPHAEFVRDRTEAEDRDAKDTFLLAHRFLYDACPHGLRLDLPAPLSPALRAALEEWAARGLVKGELGPAAGTVEVHVARDALDLVTYDHPLLPPLLAAMGAQRPEARAHYRKIIAKEASSRTCFFRLYSNVRFLTVFGPLPRDLAELIAAAPVGGPPSSGGSTGSGGSGGAAIAKRGWPAAGGKKKGKKQQRAAGGGKKRKVLLGGGGGGGGGGKKRIKREEGDEGYVGAGYRAAKREPSNRARRAVVGKRKADDDFCYSWSDVEIEEEEEEDEDDERSSASGSRGGWMGAGAEGTQDMLPSQEDGEEWAARATKTKRPGPPSFLTSSSSSAGSGATATAPLPPANAGITTTTTTVGGGGRRGGGKRAAWESELDSCLGRWFPRQAEAGDHATLYEAPCDPNDAFERWCRETGLVSGGSQPSPAPKQPISASYSSLSRAVAAARAARLSGVVQEATCCDKTTMTAAAAEGEEEDEEEEEEEDGICISQEFAAALAPCFGPTAVGAQEEDEKEVDGDVEGEQEEDGEEGKGTEVAAGHDDSSSAATPFALEL
jgi:hypothetical protein